MSKRIERWPIWKIAAAALGCVVLCPLLFWLSTLAENGGEQTADPGTPAPVLTLSAMIGMLGLVAGALGILSIVWLAVRIQDARTPAWKKRLKKKRR
jgi:hypothetical protein